MTTYASPQSFEFTMPPLWLVLLLIWLPVLVCTVAMIAGLAG